MDYITYLKNVMRAKEAAVSEMRTKIEGAETAKEVRDLGKTLDAIMEELNDAKEQLKDAEDGKDGEPSAAADGKDGEPSAAADGGAQRGFNPLDAYGEKRTLASFKQGASGNKKNDPFDTEEYRNAFMEYVCRNKAIPVELREAGPTTAADGAAVIPTTILNEMITKMKAFGNVYAKVRKMNVQGGVAIPILSLKPEAVWIGETKASEDQKIKADEKITFSYFGVECKISQTLLASVVTLSMFQSMFVELATEAIVKAIEIAIFKGSGNGQMLGITKENRIPTENIIEMTDEEFGDWKTWKRKVFAKMKKSYRQGEFIMNQATFDGYIDGMTDKNGQPIGRVNYGIEGEEKYRFGGKNIETVEDEIITAYESAVDGEVVAVFVKLQDYAINSNMQMTTVKWTDNDTNELKNKCMLICDGKLVDPEGVLIIKRKLTPETPSV